MKASRIEQLFCFPPSIFYTSPDCGEAANGVHYPATSSEWMLSRSLPSLITEGEVLFPLQVALYEIAEKPLLFDSAVARHVRPSAATSRPLKFMNHRLLTDAEKAHNARGRVIRRSQVKREKRRAAARDSLQHPIALLLFSTGDLTDEEFHAFHYGHANQIRRIAKLIDSEPAVQRKSSKVAAMPEQKKKVVLAPTRLLNRTRRGWPLCRLTSARLPAPPELWGRKQITDYFRREDVIQYLPKRVPLPGHGGGQADPLLHELGGDRLLSVQAWAVDRAFTAAELKSLRLAVSFDSLYQQARDRYAAMVPIEKIAVARGDWGAWKHSNLDRLHPEINVPVRQRRRVYLINRLSDDDGEAEELHFYSITYNPLFRLPLRLR